MKYVNPLFSGTLLGAILLLVGCATGGDRLNLVTDGSQRPDLLSTVQYIPEQKTDPELGVLPYEAGENPYLSQRGRVRRESVLSFMEARRVHNAGNQEQAQTLLKELAAQDRSLSGPWVMLGDIDRSRGHYEQAIQHYVTAIEINRLNVNAYLRLAKTQRLQGQFLHAQNTYAKALSIWPDFPEAHLNLAILYDVYLNHPLRAQQHMEAYQYLTGADNKSVSEWLSEIQQRTGIAPMYKPEQPAEDSDTFSYQTRSYKNPPYTIQSSMEPGV